MLSRYVTWHFEECWDSFRRQNWGFAIVFIFSDVLVMYIFLICCSSVIWSNRWLSHLLKLNHFITCSPDNWWESVCTGLCVYVHVYLCWVEKKQEKRKITLLHVWYLHTADADRSLSFLFSLLGRSPEGTASWKTQVLTDWNNSHDLLMTALLLEAPWVTTVSIILLFWVSSSKCVLIAFQC